MIIGCNKRNLHPEVLYPDEDQIKITHEYKFLGIDFYSHNYFNSSSEK